MNTVKSNTIAVNGQIVKLTDTCFAATELRQTEKAILFEVFTYSDSLNIAGSCKQVWLPKSQIKQVDTHIIDMPAWLFEKTFAGL